MVDSVTQPKDAPVSAGASVTPIYTTRNMKMYVVNEVEIQSISSSNAQATAFFSVASFICSASIGIYTNSAFAEKLTTAGEVAYRVAAPVLIVLSLVFAALGALALRARHRILEDIRRNSGENL